MADMPSLRDVGRLAALVLPIIALSALLAAPGALTYALAAVTTVLVAVVIANGNRDERRRVWSQSRLELLLGGVVIVGVLGATFSPIPPPSAVIDLVAVATAVFLAVLAIRVFARLRVAVRRD